MISNIFKNKFSLTGTKLLSYFVYNNIFIFYNVSAQEVAPAVSPEVAYILNTFLS